jgi:hypothetical protein
MLGVSSPVFEYIHMRVPSFLIQYLLLSNTNSYLSIDYALRFLFYIVFNAEFVLTWPTLFFLLLNQPSSPSIPFIWSTRTCFLSDPLFCCSNSFLLFHVPKLDSFPFVSSLVCLPSSPLQHYFSALKIPSPPLTNHALNQEQNHPSWKCL